MILFIHDIRDDEVMARQIKMQTEKKESMKIIRLKHTHTYNLMVKYTNTSYSARNNYVE